VRERRDRAARPWERQRPLGLLLAVALLLGACGGEWDSATRDVDVVAAPTEEPPAGFEPAPCDDVEDIPPAVASYPPAELQDTSVPTFPAGSRLAEIQASGRLRVGTSSGTLLFASVDPRTGQIDGFDIDIARLVAGAIFGVDPASDAINDRLELVTITSAQRIPGLEADQFDMVALTMTINCRRWQQIAFSRQYYAAAQTVLVKLGEGDGITSFEDLAGRQVCAHAGSTSLENLRAITALVEADSVVEVPELTDCLVAFQQGEVDAISTDDTILAGFAAQDPYAEVLTEVRLGSEPYGLGFNANDVELVQFVNAVLDQAFADGTWDRLYERWLGVPPTDAARPPADYTRPLPS
jgi:polar amino acid transport system substrate-binding protein